MKKRYVLGIAAVAAVACMSSAQAMDTFMVGPRAMGMAGANVASVDNNSAQYYNPAAFGFFGRHNEDETKTEADRNNLGRKDFGFDVYAGVGLDLHKDLGKYLDKVAAIGEDRLKSLSDNGIKTASDLQDIVTLVTSLNGLDEPGNALLLDVNAGTSLRIKHFGLGARGYSQVIAYVPKIDQDNLGLNLDTGAGSTSWVADINNAGATIPGATDGNFVLLTTPQQNSLINQLTLNWGVANGGTSTDAEILAAVEAIDAAAVQQGITAQQAQELIDTFIKLSQQTSAAPSSAALATNDLSNNTTTVVLNGFAVAEVPLTYGYALNDNVSIGANLKLMRGRVYGNQVLVFSDSSGDVLAKTDENYQETTTYGVDLGVLARYGMFNFGLTGRNLNSPKFDGFSKSITYTLADGTTTNTELLTVADVKIKPQATAGIAFIPFETLTIEADYDLTKNETILADYDTQNFSAGLEWDLLRFLALRAGAYKNMAESDAGWVYTAGVGLNLWAVRVDVAGAMSPDKVQYDGEEYPKMAKASVQVSFDF